jgi:hypothetical protein
MYFALSHALLTISFHCLHFIHHPKLTLLRLDLLSPFSAAWLVLKANGTNAVRLMPFCTYEVPIAIGNALNYTFPIPSLSLTRLSCALLADNLFNASNSHGIFGCQVLLELATFELAVDFPIPLQVGISATKQAGMIAILRKTLT